MMALHSAQTDDLEPHRDPTVLRCLGHQGSPSSRLEARIYDRGVLGKGTLGQALPAGIVGSVPNGYIGFNRLLCSHRCRPTDTVLQLPIVLSLVEMTL